MKIRTQKWKIEIIEHGKGESCEVAVYLGKVQLYRGGHITLEYGLEYAQKLIEMNRR